MTNSEISLRVTGQSSQGGRKYMEDAFVVAYQQTEDKKDLEYAFFGIFDGHGGKEAALYAKNNLLDNIVSLKSFWQDDDELILSAIRDGFLNTHLAMWKEVDNWPKTPSGLPSTAGTTASIAFIRKGKLYTGHVGDSRIIIGLKEKDCEEWQAESLTTDHKPESPEEKKRILNSGGLVMNKSGVERVVWKRPRPGHEGPILRSTDCEKIPFLAVARSLGDLWSFDYFQQEFAVSPEPDLGVMSLDLNKDKCLILASDGLWNIMTPQSAIHLVQDVENENIKLISKFGISENTHLSLCNPSRVLVNCSLERWNQLRIRADNVSVVAIMLDEVKSSDAGVLKEQLVLKMNYPRSLPVWDVGIRKSTDVLERATETTNEDAVPSLSDDNFVNQNGVDEDLFQPSSKAGNFNKQNHYDNSMILEDANECCSSVCEVNKCNLTDCCTDCKVSTENTLTERHSNSPLQSCSNFLPEYYPKQFRRLDMESTMNGQNPFPCWSKSGTGATSLSKLVTWSKVVSHRRMSDPFPCHVDVGLPLADEQSLSDDDENRLEIHHKKWVRSCLTEEQSLLDDENRLENHHPKWVRSFLTEEQSLSDDENKLEIHHPKWVRSCLTEEQSLSDDDENRLEIHHPKWVRSCLKEEQGESFNTEIGDDSSRERRIGGASFEDENFKVCLDQLCSIKQAIKRKYPGTEISHSFIGSSTVESCVNVSHKKKLDSSSNILKITNLVTDAQS